MSQEKDRKLKFFKNVFFALFLVCVIFLTTGASSVTVPINAKKNAVWHNNMGLRYLKENNPRAAIECFKISLGLNPNKEVSSTVYNNLGNTYMQIGSYDLAQECFAAAIRFAPMHFEYYKNLVASYSMQGQLFEKLYEPEKVGNGMNDVVNGLIYIEMGEIDYGCIFLRDFANKEPNLIITPAIKQYVKELTKLSDAK